MIVASHPRYREFMAVFAPKPAASFGVLSPEALARLSDGERTELLALLEQREAAQAETLQDTREPIGHLLLDCIFAAAKRSADPDAYLDAALAHERACQAHLARIKSARPQSAERKPIEELLAQVLADIADARRLATEDRHPPPDEALKRPAPEVEVDRPNRQTLPRHGPAATGSGHRG